MSRMKHWLAFVLALLMMLPACAEETAEDDWSFVDLSGEQIFVYDSVEWAFPVDIMDMEPELVRMVNKSMFLAKDFEPDDLVKMKALKLDKAGNNTSGGVRMVDGTWQLRRECAEALVALCDAARAEGHELYLKSGYRSYYKQAVMYENRIKKYGYDDGWVTKPGASDHQTGLGCDVVPKNWTDRGMNEDMAREPETQWMAEHCAEFGFILRYPADKEDITQINYEPWHLRYVGKEAAAYIMDNGLCLEEFYEQLMAAIDAFIAAGGQRSLVEGFIQESAKDHYARY
ncbi:MAG: M15 family metallopeptidase [Aristaeellaceae bacterium]